jgi:hypothetical protein
MVLSLSFKVSIFFIWLSCHRDCLIVKFPVFFFHLAGVEWSEWILGFWVRILCFFFVEFRIFKSQEFTWLISHTCWLWHGLFWTEIADHAFRQFWGFFFSNKKDSKQNPWLLLHRGIRSFSFWDSCWQIVQSNTKCFIQYLTAKIKFCFVSGPLICPLCSSLYFCFLFSLPCIDIETIAHILSFFFPFFSWIRFTDTWGDYGAVVIT